MNRGIKLFIPRVPKGVQYYNHLQKYSKRYSSTSPSTSTSTSGVSTQEKEIENKHTISNIPRSYKDIDSSSFTNTNRDKDKGQNKGASVKTVGSSITPQIPQIQIPQNQIDIIAERIGKQVKMKSFGQV